MLWVSRFEPSGEVFAGVTGSSKTSVQLPAERNEMGANFSPIRAGAPFSGSTGGEPGF